MVSIIIVNYNTSALVLDCIDSICRHTRGVPFEIIVADNNSSEEQTAMLRHDDRFALLLLDENIGFGRANNRAAEKAHGDILFLLNPDTILLNDAVALLAGYMQAHPEVAICGGNLYDAEMQPTHSYHRIAPSILSEMDFATGQIYRRLRYGRSAQFNHTGEPLKVEMITGADLMIRRDVWQQLKGFDEDFFMYCEDADLCYRCHSLGFDVVSFPDARIQHLEGRSFRETETHCRRILDGRFIFFRKHYSALYNLTADILNILSLCCAVCVSWVVGKRGSDYRIRLKTYLKMIPGTSGNGGRQKTDKS